MRAGGRREQNNKTSLLTGLQAFNPFVVVGSSASACIALIITEFTSIYSYNNVMRYKSPVSHDVFESEIIIFHARLVAC